MAQMQFFEPAAEVVQPAPTPPPKAESAAQLRPYQLDILDRIAPKIATISRRGIVQGETGAGKTFVMAEMARRAHAKGKRCLLLADRRRLVQQIGGALDRFRVPYGVVMSGRSHSTRENVIVASRDTLSSWSRDAFEPWDLIAVDEAHKATADLYQHLLSIWPRAVCLGFTATPARSDGRSLGSYFGWLESIVPASQLIAEGWLLKPEVWAPIELARKRKSGGKAKGLAGDPVAHWRRHAEGLPTIAFAANTVESLALRDRFLAAGIPAEHIDQSTPDDDSPGGREAAYRRLASGQTMVLSSVGLLVEGVDIPEAAAALIWAPFTSLVRWRQACGRIMRPAPWAGKTRAVVLDHSGAAGLHGEPGSDLPWSIDCDSSLQERVEREHRPRTITCPQCGLCFASAAACPSCGWRPPKKAPAAKSEQAYEASRDAVLSRYRDQSATAREQESAERAWAKARAIARANGMPASAAAGIFRSMVGCLPWEVSGLSFVPEDRADWRRPAAEVWPKKD